MAKLGTAAEKAREFARNYVNLVEALLREGVPEDLAREEARMAATIMYQVAGPGDTPHYDPALGPCPTCERG